MILSISFGDILLSFLYLFLIIFISIYSRNRVANIRRAHFIPFICYRIFSTVAFALIHIYYYNGGDTFVYFKLGNFFSEQLIHNPQVFLELLFSTPENVSHIVVKDSDYNLAYLSSSDSLFMGKILTPFCLLGGGFFLATTILFSMFCSVGLWLIFKVLSYIYPQLTLYFAWGTLYYPTISIWSSGILKDPVSILGIGMIAYSTLRIINKKKIAVSLIYILIGSYLCLRLKPYILYTFIPVMFLWCYGILNQTIKKDLIHYLIRPLIIALFAYGGYLVINQISKDAGKYSLDNIEKTAKGFHSWHNYLAETENQSGYSFGEVKFTSTGILAKVPESLFVTYFRPFIGIDTHNASTYFEGIQSFILLLITIWVLIKVSPWQFIKIVFQNPHVRSFMIFALVFGFAVGFTSFNFGALSRYKIPALPFYTASLAIIVYQRKKKKMIKNETLKVFM